jgi:hypothetical protein
MAHDLRLSNAAVNAEANALATLLNSGYIRIYDATGGRPTNADTSVGSCVLLAELRFGSTAFASASNGVLTANTITADSSANNNGTAAWYRALGSDGTTAYWDGEVGTGTADLVLNTLTVTAGVNVSISSLTHTVAKS